MRKLKLDESLDKKYWYLTTFEECPVCGKNETYKERQYTKKPDDPNLRIKYLYMNCDCIYNM